jgi:hypothetical protein
MKSLVSSTFLVLVLLRKADAFAIQGRSSHSLRRQQYQPLSFAGRTTDAVAESTKISASPLKTTDDASSQTFDMSILDGNQEDSSPMDAYKKGFAIISLITLFNASLAPVWHFVYEGNHSPPPLFLNAIVSVVAFVGLLTFAPLLDSSVDKDPNLAANEEKKWSKKSFRGGMELGFWKGLGESIVSVEKVVSRGIGEVLY